MHHKNHIMFIISGGERVYLVPSSCDNFTSKKPFFLFFLPGKQDGMLTRRNGVAQRYFVWVSCSESFFFQTVYFPDLEVDCTITQCLCGKNFLILNLDMPFFSSIWRDVVLLFICIYLIYVHIWKYNKEIKGYISLSGSFVYLYSLLLVLKKMPLKVF